MDYFAFYWTFPVPWAGFTDLPRDPDEAAKQSRTIRYQAARVRRWVAEEKGHLLGEQVFVELQPDRGTDLVLPVIDALIAKAQARNAGLVLVDFAQVMGWRRHGPLWHRLGRFPGTVTLYPTPLYLDSETLDPIRHFRIWRDTDRDYARNKDGRKAALLDAIASLRAQGLTYAAIAAELAATGAKTPNGKAWTAENVRKAASTALPSSPESPR